MTAIAIHPRGLFPAIVDAVNDWEQQANTDLEAKASA